MGLNRLCRLEPALDFLSLICSRVALTHGRAGWRAKDWSWEKDKSWVGQRWRSGGIAGKGFSAKRHAGRDTTRERRQMAWAVLGQEVPWLLLFHPVTALLTFLAPQSLSDSWPLGQLGLRGVVGGVSEGTLLGLQRLPCIWRVRCWICETETHCGVF